MVYLVTGGLGFIGSHLCDALTKAGHSVRIVDDLSSGKRENLAAGAELIEGDIRDEAIVRQAVQDIKGCFHLAAIASVARSEDEWLHTHHVNASATVGLLEALKPTRTPFVYASSAAVYGEALSPPLDESMKCTPISAYGADKLTCELHAYIGALMHKIPTLGLRFFNVYGPRQDPSSIYAGVISIFTKRLKAGKPLTINGDGTQARDFIFVGDIVACLMQAMDALQAGDHSGTVFNACTGVATNVNTIAQHIADALQQPLNTTHAPLRKGDVTLSLGNPARAQEALAWKAEIPLKEGLDMSVPHL